MIMEIQSISPPDFRGAEKIKSLINRQNKLFFARGGFMAVEYITQAWNAYRKNFWQILGGMLIVAMAVIGIIIAAGLPAFIKLASYFAAAPAGGLGGGLTQFLFDGGVQSLFALLVAGAAVAIIVGTALEAGLVKMFADALKGKAEISAIFAVAREKFWTILGANALAGLIKLALLAVLVFPPIIGHSLGGITLMTYVVWLYSGIIIYMFLALPFSLVNQSIVVGNCRAVDSVKKSFSIVKENYLQFLALAVLMSIIALLVSLVPVFGSFASFFAITPIAGLAYTAFYLAKAHLPAGAAKRKIIKRKTARGRRKK